MHIRCTSKIFRKEEYEYKDQFRIRRTVRVRDHQESRRQKTE